MKIKRASLIGNVHSTARRQSGAVLLLVTFSLILFFGMATLAIDVGRLYIIKSQLQNAADAGALRAAKELDGSQTGVTRAATDGVTASTKNGGLLMTDPLQGSNVDITVGTNPYATGTGAWINPASVSGPNNYYFARAIVTAPNVRSIFAHVLGIETNTLTAVAVAGKSWEGQIMPMFVPVVRRNSDQITGTPCNGLMYDPKDYKTGCPPGALPYRGVDPSGNWGFLTPGQKFSDEYLAKTGTTLPAGYDAAGINDVGAPFVVVPKPNNNLNPWVVSAAWTGNFGWLLSDPPTVTQASILDAVCRGSIPQPYLVTGCAPVHTGAMSMPSFADALNTRFNDFSNKKYTADMCPPDINNYVYNVPNPPPTGYTKYSTDPTIYVPTGSKNRRVVRMYVIDNGWLPGYTDDNSCTATLTGGSQDAHIVGCADFYMWQQSDKTGLMYVEYIKSVPKTECRAGSGPSTFSGVKLYR